MITSRNIKSSPAIIKTCGTIAGIIFAAGCATHAPSHNTNIDTSSIAQQTHTTAAIEDAEFSAFDEITPALAIQRAIEINPEIRRLKIELDAASSATSRDLRDPELRLLYGENSSSTDRHRWSGNNNSSTTGSVDDDSSTYGVAIRFFLPNPWTYSSTELQRKAEAEAIRAELDDAKQRLISDILETFSKLEYIRQQQKLAQQTLAIHEKKQHELDAMAAAGSITVADRIAFSRRYLKALSDQARTETLYQDTLKSLSELLCLPSDRFNVDSTPIQLLSVDTTDDGINTLRGLMLHNRSDLTALGWHTIAAESALKTHRGERRPWIRHVQASYASTSGSSTGSDISTSSTHFREEPVFGVLQEAHHENCLFYSSNGFSDWMRECAASRV